MGHLPKLLKRLRPPATLYGFPVEQEGRSDAAGKSQKGKRGVALIIAIMIISIMMLSTSELILTSQVNVTLATQGRDNLKAEYMARSGFNAGLLLLSADFAYDLFMAQQNPKSGLNDGLGDWWGLMNGLPIGGETLEMVSQFQESFNVNSVMGSGVLDQLKLFDGSFILDVSDESSKININFCAQDGRCTRTMAMLEALFACPAEKAFLDQKKLNGKELAYRIKDWIDFDGKASEESGYNDEDEPYIKREPRLRAKNAPMDTMEELRLIEGWDEEVHAVFSQYLTVFPFQIKGQDRSQVNLNTATRALLQCLFPESKGECAEKSTLALNTRNNDKTSLGGEGKKMSEILRETLCFNGGDAQTDDASSKASWFAQNSMIFRIEVQGAVGDSSKTLSAVVERTMPDPKKNEKSTYRVLYWKVI